MSRHSFHQDNGKNSSDLSATAHGIQSLLGGMSLPAGCFCLSEDMGTRRSLLGRGLMQEEAEWEGWLPGFGTLVRRAFFHFFFKNIFKKI